MWTAAPLVVLLALFMPGSSHAAHPNNSIAPRPPAPTPHGLTLIRSETIDSAGTVLEPETMRSSLDRHHRVIARMEDAEGAYSDDLPPVLLKAGRASQQGARHRDAVEFLQRALHVSRVNDGLYNANQLVILDALIDSQRALGNLEEVDDSLEYRFRLQRQLYQPGDEALLEATVAYSEWQRQAYLDGFGGETYLRLLTIHEIHSREAERIDASADNDTVQIAHLNLRMHAEYLMSQYKGEKPPPLQMHSGSGTRGTATQALHTNLEFERFRVLKKHNYRNGRHALQRVIDLLEAAEPRDTQALARAKIAQGDWYMWWTQVARALGSYEEAYALLAEDGEQTTDPQGLFEQPVELPEEPIFNQGSQYNHETLQAKALAQFDVSRLGRARSIKILELEPKNSQGARLAIIRLLKQSTFRPRLEDGKAVQAESIVRQYNFEY